MNEHAVNWLPNTGRMHNIWIRSTLLHTSSALLRLLFILFCSTQFIHNLLLHLSKQCSRLYKIKRREISSSKFSTSWEQVEHFDGGDVCLTVSVWYLQTPWHPTMSPHLQKLWTPSSSLYGNTPDKFIGGSGWSAGLVEEDGVKTHNGHNVVFFR